MNAPDAIVSAVLAALRAAPAITTGPIDEDIDADVLDEGVDEAVSVGLIASRPQDPAPLRGAPVDWVSTLIVECYARRDSATALAGRASRRLHAAAYARLMADPTLGGVLFDLQAPSIAIDLERRATRMGCCTGTYPALHRTAAHTLEV